MATWKEVDPSNVAEDRPALVITGTDIDVVGFFYFFPKDPKDLDRFTPITPSPAIFVRPVMPVSIDDFHEAKADIHPLAPDTLRWEINKSAASGGRMTSTRIVLQLLFQMRK